MKILSKDHLIKRINVKVRLGLVQQLTYNVWRAEVGGLLKHHLSTRTNGFMKIQNFISEGK